MSTSISGFAQAKINTDVINMANSDAELIDMAEAILDEFQLSLEHSARRLWMINGLLEKNPNLSTAEIVRLNRIAMAAESFSYLASRIVESKEEFESLKKPRFRFRRRR